MKSITIFPQVKDEYDLVKIQLEFKMRMSLTDSDFMHLMLEHDFNRMTKQDIESARYNIAHEKAVRKKVSKEVREKVKK